MYTSYTRYVHNQEHTGKRRILKDKPSNGVHIDFSTNDYLGLSKHPAILQSAIDAGKTYGVGATGSRLLSGNVPLFTEFESLLAKDKHTETALLFSSGFQTNSTTLSALLESTVLDAKPLVFFDKANHASLYQGVFLSKAHLIRYRHNDMDHLSVLLNHHHNDPSPKYIVTETLFGMDGDCVPLDDIIALAQRHRAFLYLDEAHALGMYGKEGYGLSTTRPIYDVPYVAMGTFSKAIGVSGGYVACDHAIKDYLLNKAAGFIYSTAPSPMVIGAAKASWEHIRHALPQREHVHRLAHFLRTHLAAMGFSTGHSTSHIVPILLGTEQKAMAIQGILMEKGILVSCIRPPTVPPKTARLRIALTACHTQKDIEHLLWALSGL